MNRLFGILVGLTVLVALALFDHWFFQKYLDIVYWRWYLSEGARISLFAAIAGIAWGDLNKNTGLISAHPLDHLGSYLQTLALPIYSMGTAMRGRSEPGRSFGDGLLAAFFGAFLIVALVTWIVVIVPLQYFLFLFCGGPARYFIDSGRRPIARLSGVNVTMRDIPLDEPIPNGWWDASISDKPFTVTSLLAALVLLVSTWAIAALGI